MFYCTVNRTFDLIKMNIHTKINYRSWVIEELEVNRWSKGNIEIAKTKMFKPLDLSSWAKTHLSSDFNFGRTTYFKKHLINRERLNNNKR